MIRYALTCAADHGFEAWFASSDAYDDQAARGLVSCPVCDTTQVAKQIMAPAIRTSERARRQSAVAAPRDMAARIAALKAHIAETFEDVGDRFAQEARAIHAGEADARPILGQAAPAEVEALKSDGVPVAPLPDALAPRRSGQLN